MTRNSPVSGCRVFLSFNPSVRTLANLDRVLRYTPFGQQTETVPKLFGNPDLMRVRKQELGRYCGQNQVVADGMDEILKISADCNGGA